jgi:glyoxylase-like metal-dependent hydrolase (beta-lactamase superfamily II)
MQLTDTVFLVAGPMYGTHQNVYAIKTEEALILIDTGRDPGDAEIIRRNISFWNLSKLPLCYVLVTHAHYEHSANAFSWREKGALIFAGEDDADGIETGNDRTAGFAFANLPPFVPCKVDIKLKDGEKPKIPGVSISTIHCPGHSNGSVAYFLEAEKRILFSGDTVLAGKLCRQAALGWTGAVDFDRHKLHASLEKISSLEIDILLPGHGEICMDNASALLRDACVQARLKLIAPLGTAMVRNSERDRLGL